MYIENNSIPNVPDQPDLYYRSRGWKGWRDFLGVHELAELTGQTCSWCGPEVPAADLVTGHPACEECLAAWCAGVDLDKAEG